MRIHYIAVSLSLLLSIQLVAENPVPPVLRQPAVPAPAAVVNSECGNGDFESSLDPAEWQGAAGTNDASGLTFTTSGISPGPLTSGTAHQTWVDASTVDAIVGIPQVAPGGSTHAVRIGNAVSGNGAEKLSKTFVVTAANSVARFWFAVVMQDPGHMPKDQPAFLVRVLDASGTPITGVVNLGNPIEPDKLVADRKNPFFSVTGPAIDPIVFRPWTCAYIDLTGQIGKTVTVEFITQDCRLGAHYAYAYVDNYCGNCGNDPAGDIRPGTPRFTVEPCEQLCFDYTLPQVGSDTGTLVIQLELHQSSGVTTLTSPVLSSGDHYCFDLSKVAGLSLTTGSFSHRAVGLFFLDGRPLAPKSTNLERWVNRCDSTSTDTGCCSGANLIVNGGFEAGATGFTSAYTPATAATSGLQLIPGRYAVINSTQAVTIANWNVKSHTACDAAGKFLAINGETGRSSNRVAWSQTVSVVSGAEYRFCANLRNLPQCAFDVRPTIDIRFSTPGGTLAPTTISASSANGCDWIRETRTVTIPNGVTFLTAEILLDETGIGDGNDIAIDDISLQQMQPADPKYLLLNIGSANITSSTYNVTAAPVNGQPFSYSWEVCEADNSGNCLPGTRVVDPPEWRNAGPNNFRGYSGSSTLTPGAANAGIFDVQRKYKVTYSVFGLCTTRSASTWHLSFNFGAGKISVVPDL
jgi:hypothetical protein